MPYGPTTIRQSNNVKLYPASPSTAKTGQQHTTRNATCYSRYPVSFSNGVWKYTLVVPSANNQIATRPTVAIVSLGMTILVLDIIISIVRMENQFHSHVAVVGKRQYPSQTKHHSRASGPDPNRTTVNPALYCQVLVGCHQQYWMMSLARDHESCHD